MMGRTEWIIMVITMLLMAVIVFSAPYAIGAEKMSMLESTVRIDAKDSTGTGVVIYSDDNLNTYIATAAHVVKGNRKKLEAPDGKGMVTVNTDLEVQFFRYAGGRMVETVKRTARIHAFDDAMDIAILKVAHRSMPIRDGRVKSARIGVTPEPFDEVFSVGAGLSQVPFPTQGIVASLDGVSTLPKKGDPVFILHSAHVIWGFSGGGLWRYNRYGDTYELIGINVQVSIEYFGMNAAVLTFMSLAVRMHDVVNFARKHHVPL